MDKVKMIKTDNEIKEAYGSKEKALYFRERDCGAFELMNKARHSVEAVLDATAHGFEFAVGEFSGEPPMYVSKDDVEEGGFGFER